MAKTLGQLSETTALSDSDVMLVEQVNIDKKVSITTIKQKMLELSGTTASSFAAGNHNHDGTYEPVIARKSAFNADFGTTHITVAYGDHDHNGVYEPVITKKTAFNADFGTTHSTIAYGDHNHVTSALTVVDVLPEMTGGLNGVSVRSIGSASARFSKIYTNDIYIGATSFYINGKQVISDVSNVLTLKTNTDQGVTVKTQSLTAGSGSGNLNLQSGNMIGIAASGEIQISVGNSVANKNLSITNSSTGGQIFLNSSGDIELTAPTVEVNGGITVSGSANISGSITVSGNLIVSGTTTQVNTVNLLIQDNIISLNSSLTSGTPPAGLVSGIDILRGDSTRYRFIYQESNQTFRVGQQSSEQAVATREDSPTSNGVSYWDSSSKMFKTSSSLTFNGSTLVGTISNSSSCSGNAATATSAITATTAGTATTANQVRGINFHADSTAPTGTSQLNAECYLYATKVFNNVWNDIADFIDVDFDIGVEYGKVYVCDNNGIIRISSERCEKGILGIASDTFGYGLGKKNNGRELPVAIGGFVLAYVDNVYESGTPLTSSKDGILTEMSQEEKTMFPERMVATFFRKQDSEEWNGIAVNGRNWVKVK